MAVPASMQDLLTLASGCCSSWVDLPPILSTDDVMAFLPLVDCVLMVVANGMSTKSEIEESARLLSTSHLLGTVLNKSESATKGYYY